MRDRDMTPVVVITKADKLLDKFPNFTPLKREIVDEEVEFVSKVLGLNKSRVLYTVNYTSETKKDLEKELLMYFNLSIILNGIEDRLQRENRLRNHEDDLS